MIKKLSRTKYSNNLKFTETSVSHGTILIVLFGAMLKILFEQVGLSSQLMASLEQKYHIMFKVCLGCTAQAA